MGAYRFHDFILSVAPPDLEIRARLPRLWSDLSWEETGDLSDPRLRRLTLDLHPHGRRVPPAATPLFTTDTFDGFQFDQDLFFSDGESLLHVRPSDRDANAFLSPSFFAKPLMEQYTFWSFGLSMLLRSADHYVLHAAGVVHTGRDLGMLVVGPSGSGKTTLTLDAIRQGWHYVSDDAVVLTGGCGGTTVVTALGMRRHCYVDSDATGRHRDYQFGVSATDHDGNTRRQVVLPAGSDPCSLSQCTPRVLLFPTITRQARTELAPIAPLTAFKLLLDASCDQLLCDRCSMPNHARVLAALVAQSRAYELSAGLDIYRDPSALFDRLCRLPASEDACHVC